MDNSGTISKFTRVLGQKQYEIQDHLGNVKVVFNDYKEPVSGGSGSEKYDLNVLSLLNYYPFGMGMPGMGYEAGGSRYGFNGMEKDDAIKGVGNHVSFGDYGYNPRLGRRWNVEPKISSYPSLSSYVTFANNPLIYNDPDGKNYVLIIQHNQKDKNGSIIVKVTYYTVASDSDSKKSAELGEQFWEEQNGKFVYSTDEKDYDIIFDIDVVSDENPEEQANIDDNEFALKSDRKATNIGESNALYLKSDDDKIFEGENNPGITADEAIISVKKNSKNNKKVSAHEQGHTLGIDHIDDTIMQEALQGNKGFVTTTVIQTILVNAGIGKSNQLVKPNNADAKIIDNKKQDKPKDFNKGVVKRK